MNNKYSIVTTTRFRKQFKKIIKQGKDLNKIKTVINILASGKTLEEKYKDHALVDTKFYRNCRECHIEPNWLLIYKYNDNELLLFLVETRSHSDLFNM